MTYHHATGQNLTQSTQEVNSMHSKNADHSFYHKHNDATINEMEVKLSSEDFLKIFDLGLPSVDRPKIEEATKDILTAVGEDPSREGLLNTPSRVARMYEELLSGYRADPVKLINGAVFDVEYDDMVIVKDIEFSTDALHNTPAIDWSWGRSPPA